MGIAEKLTTIAENEQRVYDAGRQSERIKVEAEIAALEAEIADLTEQKQTLEAEKQGLQTQRDEAYQQNRDMSMEIGELNAQIAEKQSQIDTLNVRIVQLESSVQQWEVICESLTNENQSLKEAVGQLEAELPVKYDEGYTTGFSDGKTIGAEITVTPTLEEQTILATDESINKPISKVIVESGQSIYDEGMKAERFRFWDNLQYKGKRNNYKYGFWIWYNPYNIFYPVHDIYGDCFEAFRGWSTGTPFDVAQRLEDCGAKLNTKGTTDFAQFAAFASVITRFPELDATDATRAQSTFYGCTLLVTIDKFKVSEKLTNYNSCFKNCPDLENIIFEGPIAGNIDFSSCTKLSHDSHVSTMGSLSDTTSGKTATFSKVAVDKAFETSEGANDGSTSQEWTALVDAKPNWSIALA